MKKITLCFMATCLSFTFQPIQSYATATTTSAVVVSKSAEAVQAETLVLRLNEIKAMDKSTLTLSQKKDLRKEVKTIKQQLSDIGGGIYISAGAIILILILLIIFL